MNKNNNISGYLNHHRNNFEGIDEFDFNNALRLTKTLRCIASDPKKWHKLSQILDISDYLDLMAGIAALDNFTQIGVKFYTSDIWYVYWPAIQYKNPLDPLPF